MAQKPDAELGDDFSYILRLAQADVDGLKPIGMGLTSIKGVGQRTALALCDVANVDGQKLGGHLSDEELDFSTRRLTPTPHRFRSGCSTVSVT